MDVDLRDILIGLNILSMTGGIFYIMGVLRNQVQALTLALDRLRIWLDKVDSKLDSVSEKVAAIEALHHRKERG